MSNDYYESHRGEWQWQDGEYTVTRTTAWSGPGCHDGCGVLYYTKDGKLEKVEGDPDNPFNQGALCMRCLEMPEFVNNPTRLGHPMKRAGERGENKWERVSWEEALDLIEEKVRAIWKDYGPESIVCHIGTGRNNCDQIPYLCYAGVRHRRTSRMGYPGRRLLLLPALRVDGVAERRLHDRRLLAAVREALRREHGLALPRSHRELGLQRGRLELRQLLRRLDRGLHAARLAR